MKLVIVGSGYVGLVTGACFSEFGYETICVDKDQDRINQLNSGVCPFYEPGMEDLLNKHLKNIYIILCISSFVFSEAKLPQGFMKDLNNKKVNIQTEKNEYK